MKKFIVVLGLLMAGPSFAKHLSVVSLNHHHVHTEFCEHVGVEHAGHLDYLHDEQLHYQHGNHYDKHVLEENEKSAKDYYLMKGIFLEEVVNKPKVPHGDHTDYIYKGMLIYVLNDDLYNHGTVKVVH